MEFQQLEMFAAVVEENSVSRAAERVCRTAPAVSIALRKLEDEIGTSLFDRSERHNYQLTPAGRLLYSHATRILEMRRAAEADIKGLAHGQTGTLRVGTHESTSLYLLPSLIHTFNQVHPGFKTEVICGNAARILKALANGAIELAIIGEAPEDASLDRQLIKRDELVLIVNPEHRLRGRRQVHVHDLSGEFLIVQGSKSLLRERIVLALQESDVPFNLGVENVPIEAIKRMVAEGLGIGLVPRMCVEEDVANERLVALKVEGLRNEWHLSVVFRKDRRLSAAARAFVDISLTNGEASQKVPHPPVIRTKANVVRPRKSIRC